jgi:hypothetical protein
MWIMGRACPRDGRGGRPENREGTWGRERTADIGYVARMKEGRSDGGRQKEEGRRKKEEGR